MAARQTTGRFGSHYGALGFLRLLFASLVIVSHTPDLVDGNADRDVLVQIVGGQLTSGGVAVSGFFIISGFLITASYLSKQDAHAYIRKRVARLYPAFGVMFLICAVAVRPLAGGAADGLTFSGFARDLVAFMTLHAPDADGAFGHLPHPSLNGAIWTLPYELTCYLVVLGLGASGVLGRVRVTVSIAMLCLSFNVLGMQAEHGATYGHEAIGALCHALREPLRLVGLFFSGATFFLLQHRIRLSRRLIVVAIAGLSTCLFVPPLVNFGIAMFGSYLIFAFAQVGGRGVFGRINSRNDISYGLYIYAWPIEQILITVYGSSSLLFLGVATWLLSVGMGWISWILVERPVMRAVRERAPGGDFPIFPIGAAVGPSPVSPATPNA